MSDAFLEIRPIADGEEAAVAALWTACNLVVSYNDPFVDIARCRKSPASELFVGAKGGRVVATVMVGEEGHRGWLYYVAVDPGERMHGYGRTLIRHAETWLKGRGMPKVMLMVRDTNTAMRDVYERLGYTCEPRLVMAKWLEGGPEVPALVQTVTSLEMFQRPTKPPAPTPALKLALMRLDPPTVSFYRYLFNTVGGAWTWVSRRFLDDTALGRIILDPKIEITVAYVGGVPAGYFELDRRIEGECELAFFGLVPEFIGRGLGRWLLDRAIEAAWSAPDVARVWVHTCNLDHPRALGVYQKAGFKPFKQFEEPMRDPRLVGLPWPPAKAATS
jgi:ribosomal protein S18 acetylase RimI-like enzyme